MARSGVRVNLLDMGGERGPASKTLAAVVDGAVCGVVHRPQESEQLLIGVARRLGIAPALHVEGCDANQRMQLGERGAERVVNKRTRHAAYGVC
jgi:hypothetical protein